jgi:hypothetical protein
MIANTNELMKKIVSMEFMIFRKFQVDAKNNKCPFQWWEKHESMIITIGFLACWILRIIDSQIERLKRYFL